MFARRHNGQLIGHKPSLGPWQRRAGLFRGDGAQEIGQMVPAAHRRLDRGPLPDHDIDRLERAAQQDGACDHRARRQFTLEDEISAEAEHGRLQKEAEGFGRHGEAARPIACADGV